MSRIDLALYRESVLWQLIDLTHGGPFGANVLLKDHPLGKVRVARVTVISEAQIFEPARSAVWRGASRGLDNLERPSGGQTFLVGGHSWLFTSSDLA